MRAGAAGSIGHSVFGTPVRKLRGLLRRVRSVVGPAPDPSVFDLRNLTGLNACLTACGVAPLTAKPRQADDGVPGAIRYILGVLASRPRLAKTFPRALSDGPDGAFALWLGRRLSAARAANVRAAFASYPGDSASRVYELRQDLVKLFSLGLCPHRHREQYLTWFLTHGAVEHGLKPDSCLWFLFEQDETPDRGLVKTYLLRADWQQTVPDALTPDGWDGFKRYIANRYEVHSRWLRGAALSPESTVIRPPGLGANVIGHYRYVSGLQEAAFGVVRSLERCGVSVSKRDLPVTYPTDTQGRENYLGLETFDTTIYLAAVNTFPSLWMPRAGLYPRPEVHRVAVWYWELEVLPPEWRDELQWPDEVWAPTNFIADAVRKVVNVPVLTMLPGVDLPDITPKPRSHFGLPDGRFLVLFNFDMGSVMARKNPLGLIAAFRAAFAPDEPVHLAVKVSRGSCDPESLAALKDAAAAGPNVTVIDRVMTRADALALLSSADCYASLHRSEGLGLGMAECMLMGKPVVATGYSGNMDFMTPDVAHLIEYHKVPTTMDTTDICPYPKGSLWAEPSVEHAAMLLRQVFDHPAEAAAMGQRAKAHIRRHLSAEAAGRRMADRLREIERERTTPRRQS